MDDCTTGEFGSSLSISVLRSVYQIASFFTSQAHSSISASLGKFFTYFYVSGVALPANAGLQKHHQIQFVAVANSFIIINYILLI